MSYDGSGRRSCVEVAQRAEVTLGRWSPSELAYIEDLELRSSLGEPSTLEIRALFQRRGSAGWPDPDGAFARVRLRFEGVGGLHLKDFGGGAVQVMGFDIHYIGDRGWEGIKFEIEDYEDGRIAFMCRGVKFLEIDGSDADV